MVSTAFLSMWISNTATAMMMVPIALAVINETNLGPNEIGNEGLLKRKNFSVALMLSIAYAASFGGIATIIGTHPNTILVAFIEKTYNQEIEKTSFCHLGTWKVYSVFSRTGTRVSPHRCPPTRPQKEKNTYSPFGNKINIFFERARS